MCGYTASRHGFVERENRVDRSARLERADLLKIFTLEEQRRSARRIQARTGQDRRAIDMPTNALVRPADGIKVERH